MSLKSEELNVDFLETFDPVFFNRPVATCIERTTRGELTFRQSCLVGRRIDYRFSFIEPGHARIFIRLPSTDFRSKRASRGPDCQLRLIRRSSPVPWDVRKYSTHSNEDADFIESETMNRRLIYPSIFKLNAALRNYDRRRRSHERLSLEQF